MRRLASFRRPDQSAGYGFVQDGLVLDCSANDKSLLEVIRAGRPWGSWSDSRYVVLCFV